MPSLAKSMITMVDMASSSSCASGYVGAWPLTIQGPAGVIRLFCNSMGYCASVAFNDGTPDVACYQASTHYTGLPTPRTNTVTALAPQRLRNKSLKALSLILATSACCLHLERLDGMDHDVVYYSNYRPAFFNQLSRRCISPTTETFQRHTSDVSIILEEWQPQPPTSMAVIQTAGRIQKVRSTLGTP